MRKSKARLVIELVGPTEEVESVVDVLCASARRSPAVQVSYPEPMRFTPILRNRKPKAAKPERKARKANSQQQPVTPVDDQLGAVDQ